MDSFGVHMATVKPKIDISNELSSTQIRDHMQNLGPREVDCSTYHLGAANFMTVHLLGLGIWILLIINRNFQPLFVFIL